MSVTDSVAKICQTIYNGLSSTKDFLEGIFSVLTRRKIQFFCRQATPFGQIGIVAGARP